MAEHQKVIGDFLVVWRNDEARKSEFHVFHSHTTEKESNNYIYCIKDEEGEEYHCRKCEKKVPTGVIYFGKTRRLSEEES